MDVGLCIYEKTSIESVTTTCACNYSLREKPTKRLRALAHLMGARVPRPCAPMYLLCAHTYTRAYLRGPYGPARSSPSLSLLSLFLSFGRYRYGAHKVGPGPRRHLATGCLCYLTRGQDVSFFFRPAPFPFYPELREEDSLRGLSPFSFLLFLFTRRIKKGTRDLLPSAETLSSSATCPLPPQCYPFCGRYVRARATRGPLWLIRRNRRLISLFDDRCSYRASYGFVWP